jgi:hypothetical protein
MAVNPKLYQQFNSSLVELTELKVGEKYYDPFDSLIYVMLGIDEIDETNQTIKYTRRLFKSQGISRCTINNFVNNYRFLVYRYKRHDKPSFDAGFKAAMQICTEHMSTYEQENAGIESDLYQFLKMQQSYNKWKQNQ